LPFVEQRREGCSDIGEGVFFRGGPGKGVNYSNCRLTGRKYQGEKSLRLGGREKEVILLSKIV